MTLTFVETLGFSRRWHERLDDEALRALQNELLGNPRKGDPIRGCGILRKAAICRSEPGEGKAVDLILVYGKDRR